MREQERLFAAIGGVDEALLARSEKRVRRKAWPAWAAGMAACLVLAALAWGLLPEGPAAAPDDTVDPPTDPEIEQGDSPSSDTEQLPPAKADGQFHFLSFGVELEEAPPPFGMYVSEEAYCMYEEDGAWIVRPRQQPDFTPECVMEITHMDCALPEAIDAIMGRLEEEYASVALQQDAALAADNPLCGPDCLYASDGVNWDDAQRWVWFADDGQGGTFVFEASYFLEAEEGHGVRFRDMVGTFTLQQTAPQWMTELEDAAERLFTAVFSNDLSGAADLLAPDADVFTYGEDVSGWMSVGSIDYIISGGEQAEGAVVSVKHRGSTEDSYSYLTMDLTYADGRWLANWILLEK